MNSFNPATGQIIWSGNAAGQKEVDHAIDSAKKALPKWSAQNRLDFIREFQKILRERTAELATTISEETGKPLWESKAEVAAMIGKVDISIEAYEMRCKEMSKGNLHTRHKPIGVLAVLGPYNFPGHLPNGHIVPALVAGNTVILKPSELTPLVSERIVGYWQECGLPPGVINLLQGGAETGRLLASHAKLDGLLFTGSYKTGLALAKQFAEYPGKILALEMGGNNPYVIGNISNYAAAADLALQSAYLTSGQRCTCARRLILPEGKAGDLFLEVFIPKVKSIVIGPYTDSPEPFMGPVISKEAAEHLLQKQAEMINRGATPLIEMKALKFAFLTPGLIDTTGIEREDEEIFGPLLQVIRVKNFEAALAEANRTEYGLAAGLLSDDKGEYEKFYHTVRAGVINWNTPLTGASSAAPFGGIGKSGNHRPSALYAADYCSYPVASMENPHL